MYRDLLGDAIHSFVVIYRQHSGRKNWEEVGRTAIIRDEPSPQFPEGFRLYYDQATNLSEDKLKVVSYIRREALHREAVIGTAEISMRELVRAFGTRVQVELIKNRSDKIVASIWFLGEALPCCSPRGGSNILHFEISSRLPRNIDLKHQSLRMYLQISRERTDLTWSAVYRSPFVKSSSLLALRNRNATLNFNPFELRQSELVLGMSIDRRVKFSFFQKGRKNQPHSCVGEVITTVNQLLNGFEQYTTLDLRVNDELVGAFAAISKGATQKITILEIELIYFNSDCESQLVQKGR